MLYLLGYLILCVLVAQLGRHRGYSFLPIFLLSLLLTPVLSTLIILVLRGSSGSPVPAPASGPVCHRCHTRQERTENAAYCAHCGDPL